MTKYDWVVLVLVWTLAITIFVAYGNTTQQELESMFDKLKAKKLHCTYR